MHFSLSLVLLQVLCLINYGIEMENNFKSLEELDALRASFPQLLLQADKVRFSLSQIYEKQSVLNSDGKQLLCDALYYLDVACSKLGVLTSSVFDHE